jgi:hypothetical protein
MGRSPLPVRTALDMLALDFPQYRISMQAIGGKLFYVAEAARPHVQPRYVQAETAERLRAKLSVPVREFNPAEPSIPRVWDVLLGGKDKYLSGEVKAAPVPWRRSNGRRHGPTVAAS